MTDFRLAKTITFTSPFSFEESLSRLNAQNKYTLNMVTPFVRSSIGIHCDVDTNSPSTVMFSLFQQRVSTRTPTQLKLGGMILQGTLTRREDGKTDVAASSRIDRWHCYMSTSGFLIAMVLGVTIFPFWVMVLFKGAVWAGLLGGTLAVAGTVLLWYYTLARIRDELINHLKWTLHGTLVDLS